jgi:hypothetical protein
VSLVNVMASDVVLVLKEKSFVSIIKKKTVVPILTLE